jgi:hypothetical protein
LGKRFRVLVGILAVATVIQFVGVAYVVGVEQGVNAQQYTIKTLREQLHPGLIIDYMPYLHPWRSALAMAFLALAPCWLLVAAIAWPRARRRSRLL